jgi:hypothetical protein
MGLDVRSAMMGVCDAFSDFFVLGVVPRGFEQVLIHLATRQLLRPGHNT